MANRLNAFRNIQTKRRLPCGFSARNDGELVKHFRICKNVGCRMWLDGLLKKTERMMRPDEESDDHL